MNHNRNLSLKSEKIKFQNKNTPIDSQYNNKSKKNSVYK